VPRYFPGTLPLSYAGLVALAFVGKRRFARRLFLALAALAVFGVSACGGGGSQPVTPAPTIVAFTVAATSGSQATNLALNMVIDH